MARSVGLDIHARGVRAVEVTGRGKTFRVSRFLEREVTPRGGAPDPEELREALVEIFKAGKLSKNHVITAVEAQDTVVREIPVPFKTDDQIRKVIKYEAEHHLHDCDADDVVVQYTRVGESSEGTNLLVFAARKDAIGRRIEYARSAGVEPLAMDLDALAFYGAVGAAGLLEESPTCVLLDIGHRATGMVFVVDGEVRALRAVRLGVDFISQGLARDMDIDFLAADEKLHELAAEEAGDLLIPAAEVSDKPETEKSHSELERDLLHQKRDELVGRLKREFIRSSAALRGTRPERVLVTGPGLQVPGLLELLGKRLGLPIEPFRPSQSFSCRLNGTSVEQFDANAAVALGLALKGIGRDSLGIDFRREELQVANKFELLKNPLAVTVTLLFIALLAFSFYCVMKKKELQEQRFEPMLTEAYQAFAAVADQYNALGPQHVTERQQIDPNSVERDGPRAEAVRRFNRQLARMKRHLHTIVGDAKGLPQIKSALQIWNDLFEVVKREHAAIGYIDFEGIDIEQDKVRVVMLLDSAAAGEHLAAALKQLDSLQEFELEPWDARPATGNLQRISFEFKRRER